VRQIDVSAPQAEGENPVYNTQAVARLTGVPAPTFRAWERRYGVPRPARLPGGQRLYSERDVALIRWLHARTAEGMTISRALRLLEARHAAPPAPGPAVPQSFAQLQADLLDRLLRFDASGAEAVMSEAFALYSVEDVCLEVLQPVLVALFFFQIAIGVYFVWRYTAGPSDRFRTFQIASGVYLAFYVLGHMDSVFIFARTYLGIDTGWGFATGAPTGLVKDPWNIRLVPHYWLGAGRAVIIAHGVSKAFTD